MDRPDVLTKRRGGGWVSLFGLPFLIAGIGVIGFAFAAPSSGGEPPPWFVIIPFGSVFVAVGGAITFGRAGIIIDKASHTITTWWGLLAPMHKKTHALAAYDRVSVSREVRRSKNSTYTVYPVRIESDDDRISYCEHQDPLKSRQEAETVAKFLQVKMIDGSHGEEIVREPDQLDESLRDRAQRTGEALELPDPPANARTQCRVEGHTMTLTVPPRGMTLGSLLLFIPAIAIPLIVAAVMGPAVFDDKAPEIFKIVFGAFFGVFFLLLPLTAFAGLALANARRSYEICVSPDMLRVREQGLLRVKVTEISSDELEELILPLGPGAGRVNLEQAPKFIRNLFLATGKSPGILAVSDRATVNFARGLPRQELRWIHAVISQIMTA